MVASLWDPSAYPPHLLTIMEVLCIFFPPVSSFATAKPKAMMQANGLREEYMKRWFCQYSEMILSLIHPSFLSRRTFPGEKYLAGKFSLQKNEVFIHCSAIQSRIQSVYPKCILQRDLKVILYAFILTQLHTRRGRGNRQTDGQTDIKYFGHISPHFLSVPLPLPTNPLLPVFLCRCI